MYTKVTRKRNKFDSFHKNTSLSQINWQNPCKKNGILNGTANIFTQRKPPEFRIELGIQNYGFDVTCSRYTDPKSKFSKISGIP